MKTPKQLLNISASARRLGIAAVASGLCAGGIATPAASASISAGAASSLSKAGLPSAASPYGEAARFGGYDATGKVLGKFVEPVGFAVDPSESNDIYVLDRIVAEESGPEATLQYRLQKLSSTGAPIASVVLPAEHYSHIITRSDAHPLMSLAVDSSNHRVYALVEGLVNDGSGHFVPVVERVVAWSTKPEGKTLVKAPGFTETDSITGAALVAGSSVLEPGEPSKDLYQPEAITVDPKSHNLIIQAQEGVTAGPKGGPMILQRLVVEGGGAALGEHFTAESVVSPEGQIGDGLFVTQSGGLGLGTWQSEAVISRLSSVQQNFKEPKAALIAEDKSAGVDRDRAASINNEEPIAYAGQYNNSFTLFPYVAGSPVTQLTNGLYAARYAQPAADYIDSQSEVEPWGGVPVFWYQGEFTTKYFANEGIRLFTSSGTVITTIGGQAKVPCNIDSPQVALAAGSHERLFALTQYNPENETGDEVIEFEPGGKGACPQPTGTVTVNGKSGTSLTVKHGEPVTLADTVERKGEAPYRFDWFLLNSKTLEGEDLTNEMQAPEYLWPAPSTTHTFATPGTYYLAATLYGDYGAIAMEPGAVEIKVE